MKITCSRGWGGIGVVVFFLFMAMYAWTSQRGVGWQDTGVFQFRIAAADYHWDSGIALAHPLYILLARGFVGLFPRGEAFHAANLFSGVGLALALTLLGAVVVRLTRSLWAAGVAVVFLGFAHMAWWLGTVAEVYTWSLAFVMAEVYCLVCYTQQRQTRWLAALFLVNGLHWSLHNAALLGLPVYVCVLVEAVWRRSGVRRAGLVAGCLTLGLAGAGFILWQAVGMARGGSGCWAILQNVLWGDGYGRQVLGIGGFQRQVWFANMALAGLSLLNPCWLFAWRGAWHDSGRDDRLLRRLLLALTGLHGIFWARYFVPDQVTFLLPTLGLLAVWVGWGVADAAMSPRRCAWVTLAGALCAVAGPLVLNAAARQGDWRVQRARFLPFRDEIRYWVIPWKHHEDSAARFVAAVGHHLNAGDALLADATVAGPILAARQAGVLSCDWDLVTPWTGLSDAEWVSQVHARAGNVYVVSPVPGYAPHAILDAGASFERDGVLYRLIKKQAER